MTLVTYGQVLGANELVNAEPLLPGKIEVPGNLSSLISIHQSTCNIVFMLFLFKDIFYIHILKLNGQ